MTSILLRRDENFTSINTGTINDTTTIGGVISNKVNASTTPYQLPAGNSVVISTKINGVIYLPANASLGTMITIGDTGANATAKTVNVAPESGDSILLLGTNTTPYTIDIGGSVTLMKAEDGSPGFWVVTANVVAAPGPLRLQKEGITPGNPNENDGVSITPGNPSPSPSSKDESGEETTSPLSNDEISV